MIINNTNVYIDVIGNSEKEIIFLHGWGQDGSTFQNIAEYLKEDYKIYLVDLPGFGKSEEPSDTYTLEDYVDILEKIIQQYKIIQPLIIGHSFGGRVAIKHASTYDSAGRLILMNSAGLKKKKTLKFYYRVYTYKLLKKILALKIFQNKRNKILGKYGSADYKNASTCMRQILVRVVNEDLTEHLKSINIPVVLFWGENDSVTPIEHAYKMKQYLNDSGLVKVVGSGHFSYLDNPYLLFKVIESFH